MLMEMSDANNILNSFSGSLTKVTGGVANLSTKIFTIKNIFFFLIIIAIGFITYKLYEADVKKKRYYLNRDREV